MNINLKIFYKDQDDNFYCFIHAVQSALKSEKTIKIIPEIEDADNCYNLPQCKICKEFV